MVEKQRGFSKVSTSEELTFTAPEGQVVQTRRAQVEMLNEGTYLNPVRIASIFRGRKLSHNVVQA